MSEACEVGRVRNPCFATQCVMWSWELASLYSQLKQDILTLQKPRKGTKLHRDDPNSVNGNATSLNFLLPQVASEFCFASTGGGTPDIGTTKDTDELVPDLSFAHIFHVEEPNPSPNCGDTVAWLFA